MGVGVVLELLLAAGDFGSVVRSLVGIHIANREEEGKVVHEFGMRWCFEEEVNEEVVAVVA
jgi:hypothetical protein